MRVRLPLLMLQRRVWLPVGVDDPAVDYHGRRADVQQPYRGSQNSTVFYSAIVSVFSPSPSLLNHLTHRSLSFTDLTLS